MYSIIERLVLFILSFLSPCLHTRYSWPITVGGKTHVACLECGKELSYDWAGLGVEKINPPRLTAPRQTILDEPGQYVLNRTAAAGVK